MTATALFLNIGFGVIGFLVAVGIPAAGLVWQYRTDQPAQTRALNPRQQQRRLPVPRSQQPRRWLALRS